MGRPKILRMRPNDEIFAPENFWIFSKNFEFQKKNWSEKKTFFGAKIEV